MSILIVDDDESFVASTDAFLRSHGHSVTVADGVKGARAALEGSDPPRLLLLDLMLPDGNGLELLDVLHGIPTKVVIVTGHPAIKSSLSDIVGPAVSFLTKPFEPNELLGVINAAGDDSSDANRHFGLIVGESPLMQDVYEKIKKVAPSNNTVLIYGESGTGKELVAEAIHRASGRRGQFVPVNCGSLPKDLATSELFGHERGSFSGAGRRHAGFFERADQGTLFLDEITEMPTPMQVNLLRVLETASVRRVGGEDEIKLDLRVLAATNRDPTQAVRDSCLREDLYYRLRVFPISLPPLRERLSDLPLLVADFIGELNAHYGVSKFVSEEGLDAMRRHSWPGNVRELKHAVHRAFIMSERGAGRIDVAEHLGKPFKPDTLQWAGRPIAEVEKELIETTLEQFDGDKHATALALGISLTTLYNRLRKYAEEAA